MAKKLTDEIKKYYSLKNIMKEQADYYLIIGERSNGKTYSVEDFGLKDFCDSGFQNQMAIVRRWQDDFTGKRGTQMFDALVANGLPAKYTNGEWTHIYYRSSCWYLAKYDEKLDKIIPMAKPFCFGFSLNGGEHDKSTSYPNVKTILFDEFITRTRYLPDEFVLFMNILSTIIRDRDGVKIFMCGNTVNKYCVYFTEMGLGNVEKMQQGQIDVYEYGESGLKVAIEYCKPNQMGKKSNKYFAFDNPKLQMITGGAWEMNLYPHLPMKYERKNIKYTYFIEFNKNVLQCEIIKVKTDRTHIFTYIHRKTTGFKDLKKDRIYRPDFSSSPNHRRHITKPIDEIDELVYSFYLEDRVFYQDNEVGEVIRNYLQWSKSDRGFV